MVIRIHYSLEERAEEITGKGWNGQKFTFFYVTYEFAKLFSLLTHYGMGVPNRQATKGGGSMGITFLWHAPWVPPISEVPWTTIKTLTYPTGYREGSHSVCVNSAKASTTTSSRVPLINVNSSSQEYLYHLTYDNIFYATLYSPRMRRSNYQPWQTADSRRDIGNRE